MMRIILCGLVSICLLGAVACESSPDLLSSTPNPKSDPTTQIPRTQSADVSTLELGAALALDPVAKTTVEPGLITTPDPSAVATLMVIPPSPTTIVRTSSPPISPTAAVAAVAVPDSTATVESSTYDPMRIVYLDEVWADVWLCQNTTVESTDLTAGVTQTCSVSTQIVGENLVITSSGIPNHDFESTLGCCASDQNSVWTIPLEPELSNTDPVMAPDRGAVAFTVTGVAIYGPEEGPGGDAVALEYGYYVEDRQAVDLGVCGGHAGPGGEYHYHYDSNCMHWHEDSQDIAGYTLDIASSILSKVIGFAFDGFPIYSTYEQDQSGDDIEVTSSYRLKSGESGYGGIDDYDYVENLGDLDECNGHFGATPEMPQGTYHYHSTLTNGEGYLGFPYFPLCYKGNVNEDNYQTINLGRRGVPGGPPPPRR